MAGGDGDPGVGDAGGWGYRLVDTIAVAISAALRPWFVALGAV